MMITGNNNKDKVDKNIQNNVNQDIIKAIDKLLTNGNSTISTQEVNTIESLLSEHYADNMSYEVALQYFEYCLQKSNINKIKYLLSDIFEKLNQDNKKQFMQNLSKSVCFNKIAEFTEYTVSTVILKWKKAYQKQQEEQEYRKKRPQVRIIIKDNQVLNKQDEQDQNTQMPCPTIQIPNNQYQTHQQMSSIWKTIPPQYPANIQQYQNTQKPLLYKPAQMTNKLHQQNLQNSNI